MIRKNTVIEAAESIAEPVDSSELIPLAELCSEGFGYGSVHVRGPRDAIRALAAQLDGEVVVDDIGRLAVHMDVARRLIAERGAAERRHREQQERRQVEAANRPRLAPRGVPASAVPEGMSPAEFLMSTDPDRQRPSVHTQLMDEELAQGRRGRS